MATWTERWKKVKPTTLLVEPLTAAMKKLDADEAVFAKDNSREALARLSGSMKQAQLAVNETIKKCNPILHKQGIKELKLLGSWLEDSGGVVKKMQAEIAALTTETNKRKERVVAALKVVGGKPSKQLATTAEQQILEFGAWLNKQNLRLSDETQQTMKYVAASTGTIKDLVKMYTEGAVDEVKKQHIADELKGLSARLANPLKFVSPKTTIPGGAFQPGGGH